MTSVAELGHVTEQHAQYTSCYQAAASLEKEDRHEERLAPGPLEHWPLVLLLEQLGRLALK